ncbi:MAG: hypothetical protein OXN25_16170 [Candidatus Poribacteria bacterium]|nr:hypothetical protein [Candidatus Poribacteria bacterium]
MRFSQRVNRLIPSPPVGDFPKGEKSLWAYQGEILAIPAYLSPFG